MTPQTRAFVEQDLGRRLANEPPQRFEMLNDIDDATLGDIRRISDPLSQHDYIAWLVDARSHQFIPHFQQMVVSGGRDCATWLKGRLLAPDFSFRDQLSLTCSALLAPLCAPATMYIRPDPSKLPAPSSWIGAPCVFDASATYLSAFPASDAAIVAPRNSSTAPVGSIEEAVRGWHALRTFVVLAHTRDLRHDLSAMLAHYGVTDPSPEAAWAIEVVRDFIQRRKDGTFPDFIEFLGIRNDPTAIA